jgi:hypothetical protein
MTCQRDKKWHESILFDLIIGNCNSVNPAINYVLYEEGHALDIYNITEEDVGKLIFPVNIDSNNNKLTFVKMLVYKESQPNTPLSVPGLSDLLDRAFITSNSKGHRFSETIHRPFAEIQGGQDKPNLSVPELTDQLTSLTALTQSTVNSRKLFRITLTNNTCGQGCPSGSYCDGNAGCEPNK